MVSLRRKLALRAQASAVRAGARKAEAVSRTGQVVRSVVDTVDGPVLVGDVIVEASDLSGVVADHSEDLDLLDDGFGLDEFDQSQDAADDAHGAFMGAVEAADSAGAALAVADQAAADAVAAVAAAGEAATTVSGKNAKRVGVTQPPEPVGGWVNGDEWLVTDADGRWVGVKIWNGSMFVDYKMAAQSIIVPGSVGGILLENGAIDGKTITGALIRTSPSGQRMQFDVNGLTAYNAAGVQTLAMRSDGEGIVFVKDSNNKITMNPYLGIRYSSNSGAGSGHVTLEPKGLHLTRNADQSGPVIRLEHQSQGAVDYAHLRAVNADLRLRAQKDMRLDTDSNDGDLHLGFRAVRANRLVADYVTARAGWDRIDIEAPSKIVLDAPVVEFQGDAKSDAYLNKSGGISAPYAIATGTVLVPGSSNSVTVTFPANCFTAQPNILTTPLTADVASGSANATNVTTSGMTLHYRRTANTNVQWTAIQVAAA